MAMKRLLAFGVVIWLRTEYVNLSDFYWHLSAKRSTRGRVSNRFFENVQEQRYACQRSA